VHCGISGYGDGGPYTEKKAYDLLVQCEGGLVSVTGTPDDPVKVGISVADIAAGMYAYTGILTALLRRERTGEGATLEVSMLEALAEWMGFPLYYALYGGAAPARSGASHAAIAPYGPFRCGDGRQVFLGIQNEREWAVFCERVLGDPGLTDDPRFATNSLRVAHREDLADAVHAAFAGTASEEVVRRLDAAAIANARLRDVRELGDHPQLLARDRWTEIDSPAGPLRALLPPATLVGDRPIMGPIPEVGEHTDRVLAELGVDRDVHR
jgi:crotonobetainyl-CoA:carnitine CoA-transferase CaiB-like acyl-CoA transferase